MSTEVAYLDANLPEKMQPEVDELQHDLGLLDAEAQRVADAKSAETARRSAEASQARAAQDQVVALDTHIRELQTQADSLDHLLGTAQLSPEERETTTQRLAVARTQLADAQAERDRLTSDAARSDAASATDLPDHSDTLARYRALQSRIVGYRSDVASADGASVATAADRIWAGLTAVDDDATLADSKLDATQQRELALLEEELATEKGHVADSSAALASTREASAVLVGRVARYGLAELQGDFDDAILRADMGVVDVYWLEKTGISDEITHLYEGRADELKKLDQSYGMIRQKFSGGTSSNSTEGGH
jgi:hypothetical protein